MATLTKTNTLTNGTLADADDVDTNFDDIISWINTNVVQVDGGAFTTLPTSAVTPTLSTELVTKAYVDGLTTSANVTVAASGDSGTFYPWMGSAVSGTLSPVSDTGLSFNASTNALTATTFVGALTGNVTGDVTGDVTGNADTATKWSAATTLTVSGDVSGSVVFDGSDTTESLVLTVADDSHAHVPGNIDAGTFSTGRYVFPTTLYVGRTSDDINVSNFIEGEDTGAGEYALSVYSPSNLALNGIQEWEAGSSRVQKGWIAQNGNMQIDGTLTESSDARLKENVSSLDAAAALGRVRQWRLVEFDRIDTGDHGRGVIAQELEQVSPELVNDHGIRHGDDWFKSVNYGRMVVDVALAVQEIADRLDARDV